MTIEEKRLKEIQNRMSQYLKEEIISVRNKKEHVDFFLKNADDSLKSANCLYDISVNDSLQQKVGYIGLNGFLWVINAGYYSMFYNARALLENEGIKITSDLSIHSRTFDALVYFFYMTGKLKKQLFEYYVQVQEEAAELLGHQKAEELIQEYFFEKGKRASFTYHTGIFAIQNKAKTTLERAANFNKEIKRIIFLNKF